MKKYELTKETKTLAGGTVLHRIRALRDMPRNGVKAGDLGGLIEKENNLSQCGDAISAPPRNCDRPECSTTKEAQDVWRKEDGGKTAYYEWLLATSTKGDTK